MKNLILKPNMSYDGTFVYPSSYSQTLIIMFYYQLNHKIMPGVFICINNKTSEGYINAFNSIESIFYH